MVPHTGAVYMIPQWQWHIHSGMSFVPERSSYCIHMIKMNSSAWDILTYVVFTPDQINMCHAPQTTRFVIFHPERSFSLHDTRMSISFGLKTGMNSFRNDSYRNEMLFLHHINKYREIYGDGMILFQSESHSHWYHVNSPVATVHV